LLVQLTLAVSGFVVFAADEFALGWVGDCDGDCVWEMTC